MFTPCRLTRAGTEYAGTAHRNHADLCQRWDSQYPHEHNFTNDALFPADGSVVDAENYCRNPNSSMGKPWCFTSDPARRRDTCRIPGCGMLGAVCWFIVNFKSFGLNKSLFRHKITTQCKVVGL